MLNHAQIRDIEMSEAFQQIILIRQQVFLLYVCLCVYGR